jgi:sugar-specific transcriptional regulator TrmB
MALDYKEWLKKAEDRLKELKQEREKIEDEISKLENGIKAFSPLVEDSSEARSEPGLTDSIRQLFIESNRSPLAPTGIRDELMRRGVVLIQNNPLAAIHQTLSRLEDKGFIEPVPYQGKKYYRWSGTVSIGDMMKGLSTKLALQMMEKK